MLQFESDSLRDLQGRIASIASVKRDLQAYSRALAGAAGHVHQSANPFDVGFDDVHADAAAGNGEGIDQLESGGVVFKPEGFHSIFSLKDEPEGGERSETP